MMMRELSFNENRLIVVSYSLFSSDFIVFHEILAHSIYLKNIRIQDKIF